MINLCVCRMLTFLHNIHFAFPISPFCASSKHKNILLYEEYFERKKMTVRCAHFVKFFVVFLCTLIASHNIQFEQDLYTTNIIYHIRSRRKTGVLF